jgi:hypothetical protein
MANAAQVAKGYQTAGKIRFSLKNKEIFDIAVKSFNKYSKFKNNVINLNYFLLCLEMTSTWEGGFDSINTYDKAGLSIGIIQFARPNRTGNAYKLLKLIDPVLAEEVANNFGDKDPYDDPISLNGRTNKDLLDRVRKTIVSPLGMEMQLKLTIEDFYDKVYEKFLSFNFSPEIDDNALNFGASFSDIYKKTTNANGQEDTNPLKVYAVSILFDTAVNRGTGVLSKFIQINKGNKPMTEGDFIYYHVYKNQLPSKFRINQWETIINNKFKKAKLNN